MEPKEPFQSWLEAFKGEFEAAHEARAEPKPAAAGAQQAFDAWWKLEQEPLIKEAPPLAFEKDLPAPRPLAAGGPARAEDAAARIERLSAEKAALLEQVAGLAKEGQALREVFARARAECAALEGKLAQARESNEGRVSQLQTQLKALETQLKTVLEDKFFLQQAFGRLEDAASRMEAELKLEREKGLMAERANLDMRQKASELESRLARAREESSFQAGAAEELKRQAQLYGERLIRAKELTDADVAGLRQELKMSVEEVKLILRTIRQERAP